MRSLGALAAIFVLATLSAQAAANKPTQGSPLLPGGNSKEPISIEADKLVYFDKEQKAIYSGSVVAIQGDTRLTCSIMTVHMTKTAAAGAPAAGAAPAAGTSAVGASAVGAPAVKVADAGPAAPSAESSSVSHLDCAGPVTVLSKTQTATGDSAVYDKPQNKIWIFGHVTLSDRGNVTKGDKLTYDLTSGQATVDTGGTSGRVKGLFLPGSSDDAAAAKPKAPN
jgi:lipopolysaccharide export system protein LptA